MIQKKPWWFSGLHPYSFMAWWSCSQSQGREFRACILLQRVGNGGKSAKAELFIHKSVLLCIFNVIPKAQWKTANEAWVSGLQQSAPAVYWLPPPPFHTLLLSSLTKATWEKLRRCTTDEGAISVQPWKEGDVKRGTNKDGWMSTKRTCDMSYEPNTCHTEALLVKDYMIRRWWVRQEANKEGVREGSG